LLAGPQERTGFDAFGRPLSSRTAYYVGGSVHRFRSGRPGASRRDSYVPAHRRCSFDRSVQACAGGIERVIDAGPFLNWQGLPRPFGFAALVR
jgi:hypothetical protein